MQTLTIDKYYEPDEWVDDPKRPGLFKYDVCVIHVNELIKFSADVAPICLPAATGLTCKDQCWSYGHGKTECTARLGSPDLRKCPAFIATDLCYKIWPKATICALATEGKETPTQHPYGADSGHALSCYCKVDEGRYVPTVRAVFKKSERPLETPLKKLPVFAPIQFNMPFIERITGIKPCGPK